MSKTTGVLVLVGLIALSMLLLNCGSSSSRPTGLLFVASEAENYIVSFAIDLNTGALSQVGLTTTTCSTLFQTPPVACGLAVQMLLDPTKSVAFLLNQGLSSSTSTATVAPTIYGYTVNSQGNLSTPTTSQTLPLGDTALAMTETSDGSLLFVIDQGSSLTPTDCPTSGGTYGSDCPSIQVFSATPGSTTLTAASVYPLNRMPTALSVLTFTPPNSSSAETLLFVTSNLDLTSAHNDNELSVFTVDSSGTLTETYGSPYTTQVNPASVQAVNTVLSGQTVGGIFIYVGAQGAVSGTVSGFQVCTAQGQGSNGYNCTPSQVANSQLIPSGSPTQAGSDPKAMVVDPTNSFLYVACTGSNQVFGYSISAGNGTLTKLSPASVPSQGAGPFALAMHNSTNGSPSNGYQFLYVSNTGTSNGTATGSGTIGIFSAGVTSGSLSTSSNYYLFTDGQPSAMAAK